MKATGIVRRIDDLGRVVIPKEIRRTMRIREGDPLEIYTDRDGEVIFKKYSPMGELNSFAAQYAETLYKTCNLEVMICDRDSIIAVAGVPKKEYLEHTLGAELDRLMHSRGIYKYAEGAPRIFPSSEDNSHYISCAMPIISEGDVIGCVASLAPLSGNRKFDASSPELESKLVMTAANFLAKQMES